jgi:hypothetical protein
VFFTIRPRCSSIFGLTNSRKCAWRRSCVPSSSAPRVAGYVGGEDRGETAGHGHGKAGPLFEESEFT